MLSVWKDLLDAADIEDDFIRIFDSEFAGESSDHASFSSVMRVHNIEAELG